MIMLMGNMGAQKGSRVRVFFPLIHAVVVLNRHVLFQLVWHGPTS